jgi:hypothetical protein
MTSAYTVMWAQERCNQLRNAGEEGRPLTALFGGVHQSAPSLLRARIGQGDIVFPVSVRKGAVLLLAGAVVSRFVTLAEYAIAHLGIDRSQVEGLHDYAIKELLAARLGYLGHRSPYGCGTEVALISKSTPLRFDNPVPPHRLKDVRFCPRKGEPLGLKHCVDGKLTSAISLHGNVRRLCDETSAFWKELVGLS